MSERSTFRFHRPLFRNCRTNEGGDMISKDRISSLPDEILVSIVSQLQFKEAVRTGILSHRWVDIWKSTGRLDFDSVTFFGLKLLLKLSEGEREHLSPRFTEWVYTVLNSHRVATLDEFRVAVTRIFLYIPTHAVDECINFALKKQVRKLEIVMDKIGLPHLQRYVFPSLILRNFSCKSLAVLRLKTVNVTEDDISYIASSCPLLEELAVEDSLTLISLDIDVPLSQLKHLEITRAIKLKRLQVFAPKLLVFKFSGNNIEMVPFRNETLLLDEISIQGDYAVFFLFYSRRWLPYQVKRLELDLTWNPRVVERCAQGPSHVTKFAQLRELYLKVKEKKNSEIVLWLSYLLKTSPLLHNLDMRVQPKRHANNPPVDVLRESLIKVKETGHVECPHNLRTVGLAGCGGSFYNVQLIMYLLENATCLERMTISLGFHIRRQDRKEFVDGFVDWTIGMKSKLPSKAELVVLTHEMNLADAMFPEIENGPP